MIESRRMPSATSGATKYPLSSGPRWTIASHMARTARPPSSAPSGHPANPAMPHIALRLRPGARSERLVPGAQPLDDTTFVVFRADIGLGRPAQRLRALGCVVDGPKRCRQGVGIAGGNEHPSLPVVDGVRYPADAGRDHGPPGRHG